MAPGHTAARRERIKNEGLFTGGMGKRILVGILFVLVVLSGCSSGVPEDQNEVAAVTRFIRSGTQGLSMQFKSDLPPTRLFDTSDLVALIETRNQGVYDLGADKCFIQFGGFDQNIIRGVDVRQACGELPGKSTYNQEGGFGVLEFRSTNINLPEDASPYTPPLVATACYEYKTVASPQVCIDPRFFELTREQKACQVRDIGVGGGQGAPVGVTFVNVDMVGSKAVFSIDVANVGGGRIVSPRAGLTRCPVGLKYDEFDEVRYKVELSGGTLIQCSPKDYLVRMSNDRGKIVCTFDVGSTQAYETPLRIELGYNYMQSVQRSVEIIRTPS